MNRFQFVGCLCALFLFAGCGGNKGNSNPLSPDGTHEFSGVPVVGKWKTVPYGDTVVFLDNGSLSNGVRVVPDIYWAGDSAWIVKYGISRDTAAGTLMEERFSAGGAYKIVGDTLFINEDLTIVYKSTPGIFGTWTRFHYEGSTSTEGSFWYEMKQTYTVENGGSVYLQVDTTTVNQSTGAKSVKTGNNQLFAGVSNVTGNTFDFTQDTVTTHMVYKNLAGFLILVDSEAPYVKSMVRVP
jgi:hypothetical protein